MGILQPSYNYVKHFRLYPLKWTKMLTKLILLLWLVGFFLVPLIFCPACSIQYEIPKVWVTLRWIELLMIFPLLKLFPHSRRLNKSMLIALVLVTGAVIVSTISSQDLFKSFTGNFYRQDGLLTLIHLIALAFWLAYYWQPGWQLKTALAIGLSNLLIVGKALMEAVNIYFFHNLTITPWPGLVTSFFGQPNFLAGYLVITLPFLVYLFRQTKNPFWILVLMFQ